MSKKTVETTASGLAQFTGMKNLSPLDTEEVTEIGQYFKKSSGGGGEGFEPTEAQLEAMNSGITSTKVATYDTLPNEDDVKDIISDHFVAGTNVTITDNADGTQTIASTGGGGGFTPDTDQLAAMNSGITSEDVTQITTNKNSISSLRAYGGLKNYATINNGTYTANSGGGTHSVTIPLLSPITGDIVISIGNITSNDVDSSTCAFVFENDITSRGAVAVSRGDNINVPVSMGTFVATKVAIYPAAAYPISNGDTVSWTDLMICTKEDWDNSHDYQPYAMSNAELTEAIQALQAQLNQ